jgi:hypothetical protein
LRSSQRWLWRISSSVMWRHVDLLWTDFTDERILLTLVPRSRIFLLWRWRRYVPPKRRFTQDVHGATSQKTAFFKDIPGFFHVMRTNFEHRFKLQPIVLISQHQAGWSNSIVLDSYSVCAQFQYLLSYMLPWLTFPWISSDPPVIARITRQLGHDRFLKIPFQRN